MTNKNSILFGDFNLQWRGISVFLEEDKYLRDLQSVRFVHLARWWESVLEPGVFVLSGGRQVGKTTSIKIYLKELLTAKHVLPEQTLYLPCDMIPDQIALYEGLRHFLIRIDREKPSWIAVDEATYVPHWELAIKALLDQGLLRNTTLIVTGSDRIILEDSAAAFPGVHRRGRAGKDVTLLPLCFPEMVELVRPGLVDEINAASWESAPLYKELEALFLQFLSCGGYLPAINDIFTSGAIHDSVYTVYQQWIVSDFVRKGKDRTRLSDLLRVVLERYASQISFTRLAQQCQHLSVETVIDYLRHLERLDIVRVLTAFDQNTLGSFPKKDKKIHATDPFLVQVLIRWLNERELLGQNFQIDQSLLVESVVVAHAARIAPVYYIKAEGEVDVVMVRSGEFFPIEVKWSEHVRTGDLKQVLKYPQSVVLTRRREEGTIQGVPIKNILQFLLLLESSSPR